MVLSEELIYYAWSMKAFDHTDLKTAEGEKIEIIAYGIRNLSSGPDFLQGKIKIDGVLWAGNIEMHVLSSDWLRHSHNKDAAYNNVILHVVYEDDCRVNNVPVLVMKDIVHANVFHNYNALMESTDWIPCEKIIGYAKLERFPIWSNTLAIERLASKADYITSIQAYQNKNWQQLMYQCIGRYFGATSNMEVFETLTERLPFILISKNKHDAHALESLVFGIAGFLDQSMDDEYFNNLKTTFAFLKQKYSLYPMKKLEWRNFGMYASGSPTFRLAQFASFIYYTNTIFDQCLNAQSCDDIKSILKISLNGYWLNHYFFGISTKAIKSTELTNDFKERIIINAIVPVLFIYAKEIGNDSLVERCLDILSSIKSESNSIIEKWILLGLKPTSALESQALIQLKTRYCDTKSCLICPVGKEILAKSIE